jgi:2-succinyl-5-enolpyruvyl-6-hydroxy-3-cyclohexene-1-carboxylate synthase
MALQIAARKELSLHIFHDERSAAFAALGVGLSTGEPALLLCTSGTAATHFHAAVIEADLSAVPLIVLTADRPPELRDVGAPQTINQTQLYGAAVRWFHDPGVPSADASHTWRSLAARTRQETLHAIPGPVHLNLPFREPLVGTAGELPVAREGAWSTSYVGRSLDADIDVLAAGVSGRRGVIVAGKGSTKSVVALGQSLGWPVFADARSGLRRSDTDEVVVKHFDSVLRASDFASRHEPEVLIRVGEPPASKVLAQWIAASQAHIVHVGSHSRVIDPDHMVAQRIVCDVETLMVALSMKVYASDAHWLHEWMRAENAARDAIATWCDNCWSEPTIARVLSQSAPAGSNIVVSSSMPVRDLEWFGDQTTDVNVYSNRGANGIDGVVSTAVGIALATQQPTLLLIGDVAMLHDVNGVIALASRDVDLRIVVVNNNGGSIFSFLPQATVLDSHSFETLYGTPHDVHFESLAHAYGISFDRATQAEALRSALSHVGPRLIEACTDRSVNVSQHDQLQAGVIAAVNASLRPE